MPKVRKAPSGWRSSRRASAAPGYRWAKGVTAFWQAGGRVREWVRFELARLQQV
jgi:hypothetical protein